MNNKTIIPLSHVPISRAMQLLGISKFLFYKLVKEQQLTIKKIGRKSFVSVAELNALFEEDSPSDS